MKEFSIRTVKIRVIDRGEYLTVWIPGTDEWKDLLISLNCRPYYGWHKGCYTIAMEIFHSDEFRDYVISTGKKVELAGHSMGGAIAECLADLVKSLVLEVIVYGSFPVNTSDYTCYPIKRVHNEFDIVPKLFPWFKNNGLSSVVRTKRGKWPTRFIDDHKVYSMREKL